MEPSSPSTSLTLLERLRLPRQHDAWGRFVSLYSPLLTAWARRQGFSAADAEDLVQEVLVKLTEELPRYTAAPGQSFRPWLYRVTAHLCCDFRRRVATRSLPGADGLSAVRDDPPTDFEEAEYRRSLVARALEMVRGEFEARTWAAFVGVMLSGRAAADVARELGVTRNAVHLARHRVLTLLRREIDGFFE